VAAATPNPQLIAASREFSWFLYDLDVRANVLVFVRTDRDEIAQQTFLDPRWKPRSAETLRVPVHALLEELEPLGASAPLNFIWHSAFCCSTLIAKLLDRPGRNLSLLEPMVLVALADAYREGAIERGVLPRDVVGAVVKVLGKPDEPHSQVTVKPSNLANLLARDAAGCAKGKALFLYSDLPNFIVSIAKGGVQYRDFAQTVFEKVSGDLGERPPWSPAELRAMSPLKIAGLAWHLQIAEMRRSWMAFGGGRAVSLNCAAFLKEPQETLTKLDGFFELGLGAEHIRAVTEGPALTRHAKSPEHAFSPQMRADEEREVRRRLGANLDRVVEWSYRMCPTTPKGAPLPNHL
jgi:hypothetical protein